MDIVEIIRKLEQGKTEPYLCRAENDKLYVVKGRSALVTGCVNEVICARLGKAFGLPIPDFKVLQVPVELLEINAEYMKNLGDDPVFGSEYKDHTQEFDRTIMHKISPELLRDLFIFDYWIKNEDRCFTPHGGNPNLFYRSSDGLVVVIDHNLAFDPEFNLDDFKRLHLGREAWYAQGFTQFSIDGYKEKMEAISRVGRGNYPLSLSQNRT